MTFSTVPMIFLVELAALAIAARAGLQRGALAGRDSAWIAGLTALLVTWFGVSVYLGLNGVFQSDKFVSVGAPYWLSFVPVALVVLPVALIARARIALTRLIDATPLYAVTAIQGLRMLAIGGIIKGWNGEFAAAMAGPVGVADFLFGVSALVMVWLALRGRLATWSLVAWNLIGAAIIVPGVQIAILLSLPGPWQVFTGEPTIMTLFAFPMVLAPAVVVPVLVMMNLFVAARLVERSFKARNGESRAEVQRKAPGAAAEPG